MTPIPLSGRGPRLASVLVLIALAACGSDPDTATDAPTTTTIDVSVSTVGVVSDSEVLELRLGTNDADDSPTAVAIREFARHVDELSAGSIIIEPVWRAAGDPAPDDWDQAVASIVISGDLDLGLIPAAAWDTEQVTSLRALNAPFLVDSDALVDAILNSDIADELMAGLGDAGVTGLALLPEGLRYVFAYGDALIAPGDFEGTTIRSPRSDTVYSLFEALGATADDPQSSEFDEQASDGTLAGVESSFARATGLPGGPTTAVGNLPLFPKLNALVANSDTFATLTAEQQLLLRDAATLTRDEMITAAPGEAAMAAEYCAAGGTVVTIGNADLAAFIEAAAPVYADLEVDPATAALIDRISALKLELPARSAIEPCAAESGETSTPPTDGDTIPVGTYERQITTADGADLDPGAVADILGPTGELRTELVIEPDAWTLYVLDSNGERSVGDLGTYKYDSDGLWVTVSTSGGCAGCIVGFDWSIDGDELTLVLAEVDGHSTYDDGVRLMTEGSYRAAP